MRFNCSASYSTYNKPLIDASTKYLTFSGTSSFNSIKRQSGNGSVFEFASIEGDQTISGVHFNRCLSSNGGAIYAKLSSASYKLTLSWLNFTNCSVSECGGEMDIDGGGYLSTSSLSFSSLTFTSCSATSGGKGACLECTSFSLLMGYESWTDLLPIAYSSSLEGVYVGRYPSTSVDLLHLFYPASRYSGGLIYVGREGTDGSLFGWPDC